ncbi:MAG: corrinoid protein [bacterium]|nr:corrinoid protein [bacterium]
MEIKIYQDLARAVVEMRAVDVARLAQQALDEGYPPEEAIELGLAAGMNEVGKRFAAQECFVPEILVCSRAMYAGFNILKSKVTEGKTAHKGTILIGVVEGDFHDIGKNIVKIMLEAAGFRLVDLGKNLGVAQFLESAKHEKPQIVALSTLMTTTMDSMAEITQQLHAGFPEIKVMVGGAPVNWDFARSIKADFYGENVRLAVQGAYQLLGIDHES